MAVVEENLIVTWRRFLGFAVGVGLGVAVAVGVGVRVGVAVGVGVRVGVALGVGVGVDVGLALSKNSPLTTALAPPVLVTLRVTLPLRFQTRYFPPWNVETVRVSSSAPVASSMACTVSLRP